jgi:hypothetical protein
MPCHTGDIIGYINLDSEQAGTVDEEYLGCVLNTAARNYIEIIDARCSDAMVKWCMWCNG